MEYSAGLTSKMFWLQESRKTAGYILKGYDKADIRKNRIRCGDGKDSESDCNSI